MMPLPLLTLMSIISTYSTPIALSTIFNNFSEDKFYCHLSLLKLLNIVDNAIGVEKVEIDINVKKLKLNNIHLTVIIHWVGGEPPVDNDCKMDVMKPPIEKRAWIVLKNTAFKYNSSFIFWLKRKTIHLVFQSAVLNEPSGAIVIVHE